MSFILSRQISLNEAKLQSSQWPKVNRDIKKFERGGRVIRGPVARVEDNTIEEHARMMEVLAQSEAE